MNMSFIISLAEKSDILKVLIKYRNDALVKRDEHKKEMDYYHNLMDLMINHDDEYPMECDDIFNLLQTNYHEHRGNYEYLCSIITSLDFNIEILLCYTEMID
jgi:hypothetical protein